MSIVLYEEQPTKVSLALDGGSFGWGVLLGTFIVAPFVWTTLGRAIVGKGASRARKSISERVYREEKEKEKKK